MAGIESLTQMLGEDVDTLAGGRYEHRPDKPGYRWGPGQGAGWVPWGQDHQRNPLFFGLMCPVILARGYRIGGL